MGLSGHNPESFHAQPEAPATSDQRFLVAGASGWALNEVMTGMFLSTIQSRHQ
jgi:hypothetical protein